LSVLMARHGRDIRQIETDHDHTAPPKSPGSFDRAESAVSGRSALLADGAGPVGISDMGDTGRALGVDLVLKSRWEGRRLERGRPDPEAQGAAVITGLHGWRQTSGWRTGAWAWLAGIAAADIRAVEYGTNEGFRLGRQRPSGSLDRRLPQRVARAGVKADKRRRHEGTSVITRLDPRRSTVPSVSCPAALKCRYRSVGCSRALIATVRYRSACRYRAIQTWWSGEPTDR
jgi:hypothetical protein